MKLKSPDYTLVPPEIAVADFRKRMALYEAKYEPLDPEFDANNSYVKVTFSLAFRSRLNSLADQRMQASQHKQYQWVPPVSNRYVLNELPHSTKVTMPTTSENLTDL